MPLPVNGIASLQLDLIAGFDSLSLNIDQNADGVTDLTQSPDSLLTGSSQLEDYSSPVSQVQLEGEPFMIDYFNGTVTATMSATDEGSGVLRTEYSLDLGKTWQIYPGSPIQFEAEEGLVLSVRSVDLAGNFEYPYQHFSIHPFFRFAPLVD